LFGLQKAKSRVEVDPNIGGHPMRGVVEADNVLSCLGVLLHLGPDGLTFQLHQFRDHTFPQSDVELGDVESDLDHLVGSSGRLEPIGPRDLDGEIPGSLRRQGGRGVSLPGTTYK
jgi:hypothetical protein